MLIPPSKTTEKQKEYYQKNRDRIRAQQKSYRQANPKSRPTTDENRAYHIKRVYGITIEEWNLLFESQGSCCAICKTTEVDYRAWHTDHCHKTNKVRGILCRECNIGIGYFEDSIERIQAAIEYLS